MIVVNLLLFIFGSILNILAYQSLQTVLAAVLYGAGFLFFVVVPTGGKYERFIFVRVFCVGWVVSGLVAISNAYFGGFQGNANYFFINTSGGVSDLTFLEVHILYGNGLSILIWQVVYDFFAFLGFSRDPYIGVLVNVTLVAMTGVVAIKMTRLIYGNDPLRFKRLILIFSTCGLFWLFAGVHLRDASALFAVTLLAWAWLIFLIKPSSGIRLGMIVGVSFIAVAIFGFLRIEFVFVPFAMALAGSAAVVFASRSGRRSFLYYAGLIFTGVVILVLALKFQEGIVTAYTEGSQSYLDKGLQTKGSEGSLGIKLIVDQPLPIRLVLGTIYLYVFPIPVWSGFNVESPYHFFKSTNAIFFYAVVPLLLISLRLLWKQHAKRTPSLLFILFLSLGFSGAIASTSLETRHLGAFLAPLFVLALLPDLSDSYIKALYKKMLVLVVISACVIHMLWLILKFL